MYGDNKWKSYYPLVEGNCNGDEAGACEDGTRFPHWPDNPPGRVRRRTDRRRLHLGSKRPHPKTGPYDSGSFRVPLPCHSRLQFRSGGPPQGRAYPPEFLGGRGDPLRKMRRISSRLHGLNISGARAPIGRSPFLESPFQESRTNSATNPSLGATGRPLGDDTATRVQESRWLINLLCFQSLGLLRVDCPDDFLRQCRYFCNNVAVARRAVDSVRAFL